MTFFDDSGDGRLSQCLQFITILAKPERKEKIFYWWKAGKDNFCFSMRFKELVFPGGNVDFVLALKKENV